MLLKNNLLAGSRKVIYGPHPVAEARRRADGPCDEFFRTCDSFRKIFPSCELGRDRGGVRATGSVRVFRSDPRRFKDADPPALIKEVQGLPSQMASFNKHGPGAQSGDDPRGLFHRSRIANPNTTEDLSLAKIRRDQRGMRQQLSDEGSYSVLVKKRGPMFADHDRIHHERKPEF